MKIIENLEKERLDFVNRNRAFSTIGIALTILGLSLMIVGVVFSFGPIIGLIVGIVGIIMNTIKKSKDKKFADTLREKIINAVINESFGDDAKYHKNQYVNSNLVNSTKLYQMPDRVEGEDLITGTYKGVKFYVSDYKMQEENTYVDNEGHRHTSYETYFKGRWYVFDYERDFGQTLKIVECKNGKPRIDTRGLEEIEVESIAFCNKFAVYTTSKQFAFIILKPQFQEKILELEAMNKGNISLAYINGMLHIAVNDYKDYLEINIKKPITNKSIEPIVGQINIIGAIINELKLDSSTFKSIEGRKDKIV